MIGGSQGQSQESAAIHASGAVAESLPWNLSLNRLLGLLDARPAGLSDKAARRRLAEYGPNDALAHGAVRCGGRFSIASPIR